MSEEKKKSNLDLFVKLLPMIVSVIVIAIGWLFNANAALSVRVDNMNDTYTDIKGQLAQIQTDLTWIKTGGKSSFKDVNK